MKFRVLLGVFLFLGTISYGFCDQSLPDESIISKLRSNCAMSCPPNFEEKKPYTPKEHCAKEYKEIKKLFEKQKKYLNAGNIEGLKKMYSDNYISNDGFNKETLFRLYNDTVKNHPDIKYDICILKLSTDGTYASAKAENKSIASTSQKSEITGDKGLLTIDMETVFYLKKTAGNWQIFAEQTVSEKTTLLYGDCKNSGVKLCAPECIGANTEYTATLKLPEKYSKYAMGSIKKELITYPSTEGPDIFKPFDSIGLIERIFKSNSDGKNETVAASVAFALPKIDKSNNIDIKISGIGVLLQRVNTIPAEQK